MYESFYQLRQTPLRRTPDPYLFYGRSIHNHDLATLRDAAQQGEGFVVVADGPGTGKTELIPNLIEEPPAAYLQDCKNRTRR
jgi:type II secretory pathway predicted ATPase ExeA